MRKIVFLHIPKTAGQTVHSELSRIIGQDATSPIRVHTQADEYGQFPAGYQLYSGHLDWERLEIDAEEKFAFTVLRDPFERIASFYFYLHHKSLGMDECALALPQNAGLQKIRQCSADDYFFGGSESWQRFILDHYDNFYCTYFATRRMRGTLQLEGLSTQMIIDRATMGAARLDAIYDIEKLQKLEKDISHLTGKKIKVASKRVNPGPDTVGTKRWPALLGRIESDAHRDRLTDLAVRDDKLMTHFAQIGAFR